MADKRQIAPSESTRLTNKTRLLAHEMLVRLQMSSYVAGSHEELQGLTSPHTLPDAELASTFEHQLNFQDDMRAERVEGTSGPTTAADLEGQAFSQNPLTEAVGAICRLIELMDSNPAIIPDLLPHIGELMKRVDESPDILRRKQVAEELDLSIERIKDFFAEKRFGVRVGSEHLTGRKELEAFKMTSRTAGRPHK
ncbi:MAG: hypothetical protein U0790_03570 [Isosphaeraceae bacterium]